MQTEARVPLDRTGELAGQRLDFGIPKTGIEYECLDVGGESERTVDVRFDVVIEDVVAISLRELDKCHPRRHAE